MYAFYGPSFYVVGGDSMEQKISPQFRFIDDGDGVIVTPLENDWDIVTYYEGKRLGYKTFGDYGDVISFDMKNNPYPISHRAVCFVKYNLTGQNITVDIPELGLYGVVNVTFEDVGIRGDSFHINFAGLYQGLLLANNLELEGYLTKGDNREYVDQGGRELIAHHSILGKVKVVDNELAVKSSFEYIFIIFVMVIIVTSYFSDLMFRGKIINKKHLNIFQNSSILTLFIFIFYKGLSIILSTEKFGFNQELNYVLYVVMAAFFPLILGYGTLRILKKKGVKSQRIVPMIIIGAFITYFFIMTFIINLFIYSLAAFSFAASLFYLNPKRYFREMGTIDEKDMSGWIFLFSFEVFILIVMFNFSLPFYAFLIIGVIFVNYFCISSLKNEK
jgi:hypothetical protein